MNKLIQLLQQKDHNILSIYFTAGFPKLNDTVTILENLQKAGADIAEVGIPFSDPMADGPVIQKSSHTALQNGMNLDILFDQLEEAKSRLQIPVILMGYLNPAFKYGMEKFCHRCSEAGVSGLIFPDLPFDIYLNEYAILYEHYDLCYIPLITPQTPDKRIMKLAVKAKGFVYMVSSSIITGGVSVFEDHSSYFKRVRALLPGKTLLIGFGIHDAETFSSVCKYANGGIIGTAFINAISEGINEDSEDRINKFILSKRVKS
jgi:tryptophan synthase alpha chain